MSNSVRSVLLLVWALWLEPALNAQTQTLLPLRSTWRYFKGTAEPSTPTTAWRASDFSVASWALGPAPIYYGGGVSQGTLLSDMRYNYTTVYLRNTFQVADAAAVERLAIRTRIDDGFIIWINGIEAARFNVAAGERAYNTAAAGVINATWVTNSFSAAGFLVDGDNTIAAQVFNANLTSSDLYFDVQIDSVTDRVAPVILSITPPPGSAQELRSITVTFSEPVQGVQAPDLLINNVSAESVRGSGATYTFTFEQPAFRIDDVRWEDGHQISDLANPPNAFDSTAASARWTYDLSDSIPPVALSVTPPPGSTVRALSQIEVRFSEPVSGVDYRDLLINGTSANSVTAMGGNLYRFLFAEQPEGAISASWAADHGIADIANNPFAGGAFTIFVDPNYVAPSVVISEFLAQNLAGLRDEDNEFHDWIELHNASAAAVNLNGWSLSDDPEDPDLWIFPDVSIPTGGRLVVFASAKNRRPAAGNLHTNFKLGADGEYLALYNAEAPRRVMTGLDFPAQRTDHSYGTDTQGLWRYYETPTPRLPNGDSNINGLVPALVPSARRGTFEAPFTLALTNEMPGVTIRYTTDFSEPTLSNGQTYTGPMEISGSTVLRAVAFRAGYLPSEIFTGSYIFLDQVLRQPNDPAGFPVGPTVMSGYPSDYEMDAEIVNNAAYSSQMIAALRALPIISVCIRMDDMFGAANGIYTHPTSRGAAWERPCSVEFIRQDGGGFQVNAGIQIQGNAARDPQKQPKHPMRVVFKRDYGPPNLDYRLFPDSPVEEFDTIVLRADFNYSWLHWNPTQRTRAQRVRDSWMKDSMRAMGGLASHNRYVHLYINGLYWGIYDPTERPDGAFGAAYLGGEKEDYDVMNEGAVVDGSNAAYNAMINLTNMENLALYETMKTYLDMTQFIDYMLLHFYVGHEDWFLNKNWYALRPKDGSSGFKYVPWDGEMILGEPGVNRVATTDLPSGLHPRLVASAEYKLAFADRVQKHFFNDGALTPSRNIERWMRRANEIELPIIAESARWGDYRRDVHQFQSAPYELYTRDVQWKAEQRRLTNVYFPGRTTTVLNQLRSAGLYPNVNAPVFNRHGGQIAPGFQLFISGTATIYYTTDGSDPRVYGTGAVAGSARTYAGPATLNSSTIVKARSLNNNVWSALTEAVFSTEAPRVPIRFTEIMYNPDPPGDAYEYLELQNFSTLPIDVSGFHIEGVDYIFPPQTTLAPGQIVLLASGRNPDDFRARYPNAAPSGYFPGQLSNAGERIALIRPDGRTVTSVNYDDEAGWPPEADGRRYSLQVNDALFGDPSDPANWRHSDQANGAPGAANPPRATPPVIIHEVFASSQDNGDFLELRSQFATDLDISNWTIWKVGNATRFVFPQGTTLSAGGYLVVLCDRLTNEPGLRAPWALDSDGDTLVLNDRLGRRMDARTLGPHARGYSISLVENEWRLSTPTPNAENVAVETGNPSALVINEWLANPIPGEDDWLEIHNTDAANVIALQGLYFGATNQLFEFRLPGFINPSGHLRYFANENAGELDFRLPAEGARLSILDPGGTLLHELTFGAQVEGVSEGRFPDASPNVIAFPFATPGAANSLNFPLEVIMDAGTLRIGWPSLPGSSFQIQSAIDLAPATDWSPVATVTAQDSAPFYQVSMDQSGTRFFRVVRLP